MKIFALTMIIQAFFLSTNAQTEKIAHRSHSGKNSTFRYTGYNNWGTTPAMMEEIKKRDAALKLRADSLARRSRADSIAARSGVDSLRQPVTRATKRKPAVKKHNKTADH